MSLADDPFSWSATKGGQLRISRGGRTVMVLGGQRAVRIREQLGHDRDQQVLARATGNDRRGNERR